MDLCSPLPDLSLSVSRMGEALFTHYEKFFGILREFNHETNFEYLSKFMLIELPTRKITKWINGKKAKQKCRKLLLCTQPFNLMIFKKKAFNFKSVLLLLMHAVGFFFEVAQPPPEPLKCFTRRLPACPQSKFCAIMHGALHCLALQFY